MLAGLGIRMGSGSAVLAQSTGDTLLLPTRTPTSIATWMVGSTATRISSPTATTIPVKVWEGRVTGEVPGAGVPFARVLVQVAGRDGQPVQISTVDQVLNTAYTGQKPRELGPNIVEFTGLTPGKYFIEPLGLNTVVVVELKENVETRILFNSRPLPATATSTALVPPTPLPLPTVTPSATSAGPPASPTTPASPTPLVIPTSTAPPIPTPTATATPTPLPSPTPVTRWIGAVQTRDSTSPSQLTVQVAGIEGIAIRLSPTGALANTANPVQDLRCITGQGGLGQDMCGFNGLPGGWYVITPEGIGTNLPVRMPDTGSAHIVFDIEVLPSGITGWEGKVHHNSNGFLAQPKTDSTIRVKVSGRQGQVVALYSVRLGTTYYCETAYNPVTGGLMCEFGNLGPGVYQVEPLHINAWRRLFVDGTGLAEIEFSPSATYATYALRKAQPVVGRGAQPRRPTPTVTPASILSPATPQLPTPLPSPTTVVSGTITPTVTAEPQFSWQGRVVESAVTGAGAIGVRAVGLKDHPVLLRSGGWQSPPQLTGTKPELGDYATEFGGLAQGSYTVELVDLATVEIELGAGEFMLVEFRYDFVTPP
jgi:hypothetical protein